MKTKLWIGLQAFLLCVGMSAFFMPITVRAGGPEDVTPPELSAVLDGEMLHIEVSDDYTGVEAVYIGGRRVNCRMKDNFDVRFDGFATPEDRTVTVYAVDYAGNRSKEVEVENPLYVNKAEETDKTKDTDTESDLMALAEAEAEKSGKLSEVQTVMPSVEESCTCTDKCEAGKVDTDCPVCRNNLTLCKGKEVQPETTQEPEKVEASTDKKSNAATVILILLVALSLMARRIWMMCWQTMAARKWTRMRRIIAVRNRMKLWESMESRKQTKRWETMGNRKRTKPRKPTESRNRMKLRTITANRKQAETHRTMDNMNRTGRRTTETAGRTAIPLNMMTTLIMTRDRRSSGWDFLRIRPMST